MNKILLTFPLLIFSLNMYAQEKITWQEDYQIQPAYFQAITPKKRIEGSQRFYMASIVDFNYAMNAYQFAFKKNFNSYVTALFYPASSWLEEGEHTQELMQLAQVFFDVTELHARRFRKRLYEAKNLGSGSNFYKEAYDEMMKEYTKDQATLNAELTMDNIAEVCAKWQEKVRAELDVLSEYCKECKPKKRKKKKKNQ
ncbi:hypothetical protein AAG747_07255 [Rapidithrix thailandica]|uniref:Uncharacterized protein n=1 Tax=Rapidithrix thailandica TaxID=413964 RepID=A0AAW9S8P4_9BACT